MAADPSSPPGAVLFGLRNLNRVRSPMAEALLKRLVGDRAPASTVAAECAFRTSRVGTRPRTRTRRAGVDPFVESVVMAANWTVTSPRHRPQDLRRPGGPASFDLVISLTPEAQGSARPWSLRVRPSGSIIEYWPTFDPTLVEGSRERAASRPTARCAMACARRIAERLWAPRSVAHRPRSRTVRYNWRC